MLLELKEDIIGCEEGKIEGKGLRFASCSRHYQLFKEVFNSLNCSLFEVSQVILF